MNGSREDYDQLLASVRQALGSGADIILPVSSVGPVFVRDVLIHKGTPPNRAAFDGKRITFSIAPEMEQQFTSFIHFPPDTDLPNSPVHYHNHYDPLTDDGTYVAKDSLPVVFGLDRA